MNRTHIETFSYQLSPQYYFNRLLKIWLHNNWGWLLSFFLLLVGLSIQNPLLIYVGLIILFLVFPMIISYLWFAYALHPDCRMSILSKTVEINKNGLSCTFDDGRTESIVWERITRIRYTSTDIIFHLSNYIFFILPYNSFKSNDDLEYFLKNFLALNIQNKK